ncbi:hypothetical protein U9M48_014349 [Paspalum notatum var. saurae]|uniref:Uncharacterized protein n=1 Tax=Paspalum notatum var. saurae TaxID=547442 RepID=A0AAQ3T441_PASNO
MTPRAASARQDATAVASPARRLRLPERGRRTAPHVASVCRDTTAVQPVERRRPCVPSPAASSTLTTTAPGETGS